MEPTLRTVRAIMSPRSAAHFGRWTDGRKTKTSDHFGGRRIGRRGQLSTSASVSNNLALSNGGARSALHSGGGPRIWVRPASSARPRVSSTSVVMPSVAISRAPYFTPRFWIGLGETARRLTGCSHVLALAGVSAADRSVERPSNIEMEPTRFTVCAIMSPRRAAHFARWTIQGRTKLKMNSYDADTRKAKPKKRRTQRRKAR